MDFGKAEETVIAFIQKHLPGMTGDEIQQTFGQEGAQVLGNPKLLIHSMQTLGKTMVKDQIGLYNLVEAAKAYNHKFEYGGKVSMSAYGPKDFQNLGKGKFNFPIQAGEAGKMSAIDTLLLGEYVNKYKDGEKLCTASIPNPKKGFVYGKFDVEKKESDPTVFNWYGTTVQSKPNEGTPEQIKKWDKITEKPDYNPVQIEKDIPGTFDMDEDMDGYYDSDIDEYDEQH